MQLVCLIVFIPQNHLFIVKHKNDSLDILFDTSGGTSRKQNFYPKCSWHRQSMLLVLIHMQVKVQENVKSAQKGKRGWLITYSIQNSTLFTVSTKSVVHANPGYNILRLKQIIEEYRRLSLFLAIFTTFKLEIVLF